MSKTRVIDVHFYHW